jgi:KaiC/GvpD/RAD55 family RecA-like ATPase
MASTIFGTPSKSPTRPAHGPAAGPLPSTVATLAPPPTVTEAAADFDEAPPRPPVRQVPGFGFQHGLRAESRLSTGVPRLDALLGGGYTAGSATLLYGPPFCGKQQLQRHGIVAAALAGMPVTVVLHTIGTGVLSARLRAMDPRFAAIEESGLVTYIDVHSKTLGEPTDHPHTIYVSDPNDVQEAVRATTQRNGGRAGLLAIESASTVLVTLGPQKAFTYLRTVLGRCLSSGGVGLICLEGGMHPESEVQMAKHLCAGMIEMRKKGEAYCLHVEGLETAFARPGWVEYEFSNRSFKVTGSFASRSIL